MFGMCNPEGVYGHHHPHHQSQHYASTTDLGSPAYCGSTGGTPTASEATSTGNGGLHSQHPYGLHAAASVAAAAAAVSSSASTEATVNNNRSHSVEVNSGGQTSHSPTGIISDNGLQYANLDGSAGGPGGYPGGGGGYGHHHMGGYHYSDIHGDGGLSAAAAAAAAASGGQGFSAYLDNSSATAAAVQYAQSQYPSIYGQHPHSLKSIRGSHDFNHSSYPADFAAAAAAAKPSPAVPTYKWMQVKRNVPKPGKINIYLFFGTNYPPTDYFQSRLRN
jgi:hypothetical protein